MKRAVSILLLLAVAVSANPFLPILSTQHSAAGPSNLLYETFDAAGYDNSWTEAGTGTIDEDYTTSPAPLAGTQSLRINLSGHNGRTIAGFAAQSSAFTYFRVRFVSALPASGKLICRMTDGSGAVARVELSTSGRLALRLGTGNAATVSGLSADTEYHVWFEYTKGTGSDGVGKVAFSTDGVKPTSGNQVANVTNGSTTTDASQFEFGAENNSTWQGIFDNLTVRATAIGDNGS